jgi:CRISPR/Cas system CSM-associated protein Csm3 (group 7 of RAMP superfamily)
VQWVNGQGEVKPQRDILIPATSLKGVLSHRMSYHARRHAGQWNGPQSHETPAPEVCALFGELKDEPEARGWAGCLYLDDAYMNPNHEKNTRLMHNSIDRFTGGVQQHRLFDEQNLYLGQFTVRLILDLARLQKVAAHRQISLHNLQKAFKDTLTDLCEGRLALGARSTSGNGFLQGTFEGSLANPWLIDFSHGSQKSITTEAA